MDPKEPKVICIMPCYNAKETLAQAIESVINQRYINWRLIIVDDASTDNSVKIAKKYLKDSRVTLLQNKTNRGCYYSRNRALHYVKDKEWDWFTVHDSDDTSHPDRFSAFMGYAYNYLFNYIYSASQGNRYDWNQCKLIYKKETNAIGQAFISNYLFNTLGYFNSNMRFGADAEYEFKTRIITATEVQDKLGIEDIDHKIMEEYCQENKVYIGALDLRFAFLYSMGYTLGNNLTQQIPLKKRMEYRDNYEEKWGQGGLSLTDFYQNFEPHPEDIILK